MQMPFTKYSIIYGLPMSPSMALLQTREANMSSFDWASITPSSELQYHDCYESFRCARLEVPLDWNQTHNGRSTDSESRVTIAIVTLPATVPETDPKFGGTVLINPGGPGGAGTDTVLSSGTYLQNVLDGERHYEVLGFDPRGVGLTTPLADCYRNDFARGADAVQTGGMPAAIPDTPAMKLHYESAKGLADICAGAGPDSIFAHMSTADVAQDMLAIVDRVEELRQKSTNSNSNKGLPKLQYLGFSYGTFLGNTFASMFPERVGRMVLDGVVDPEDYVGHNMRKTLLDAEKVIYAFYDTCFKAGSNCTLRGESDTSPDDIGKKIDRLMAQLDEEPVSLIHDGRIRLITSHYIGDLIRQMLYDPINQYETASQLLALAVAGNFTLLLDTPAGLATSTEPSQVCVDPGVTYPPSTYQRNINEPGFAVFCGDTFVDPDLRNFTWAQDMARDFTNQAPTVGESWARTAIACSGWKINPKHIFRGPFGYHGPVGKGGPSAPLLILSNRYDHATPLENAYIVSRQFEGSSVVVQETAGHCALLASKSECTKKLVSNYFATGVVPANNTICQQDCVPSIPFKACPGLSE